MVVPRRGAWRVASERVSRVTGGGLARQTLGSVTETSTV